MDAATGAVANAKAALATTLANCTGWRTFDGANRSVAEALARVYFDALPPPPANAEAYTAAQLDAMRPYIILYKPRSGGVQFEFDAVAGGNGGRRFLGGGVLMARIERTFPSGQLSDPANADRQFENYLGAIMQTGDANAPGLCELAGREGFLPITKIQESGPWRVDPNNEDGFGDFHVCLLRIEWGWQ